MSIRIGCPEIVFGAVAHKPFQAPAGVVRWRVRLSNKDFGRVYLRYPDRVELWMVAERDGQWFPQYKQREIAIQ